MNCNFKIGPFFFLLLITMAGWACRNAPDNVAEENALSALESIIPGTWEGVSMRVNVYSADGVADSSYIFKINDGDWDQLFNVLPPRTYFERDNKFRIEFRDRRDSIMSTSRGLWNVMGDTLMMIEPDQTLQYKVKYEKGLLYLIGLRDWDEDGAEDDAYQEVKRRVSIGTEK